MVGYRDVLPASRNNNIPDPRDLDSSVFVSLSRELFCFDYVLYFLSYAGSRDHLSDNGQLYTIKINKDFLIRLLKCGDTSMLLSE